MTGITLDDVRPDCWVTLEEPQSGVVATTALTLAPCVYDVLGAGRRSRKPPPARLVRDTAYRAIEDSLLGPVPDLQETVVEVGYSSFSVVLQNDAETVVVTGEYGSGQAVVRHELRQM
jgi:hypothetical protein